MLDEKNLAFLEQELNYTFQDNFVIEEALTHSSYAHENGLPYNNERLEYLGDSILSFIVARTLYRIYPEANEGELTKMRSELVKADSLYRKAEKLGIPSLILHGNAIRSDALPKKMIADAMEAVIGAVCVDGGVDVAERIIKDLFLSNADERTAELDPKSQLQLWLQARGLPLPKYELLSVTGPSHSPTFEVKSRITGIEHHAKYKSRKGAEAIVATRLLEDLKKREEYFGSKYE